MTIAVIGAGAAGMTAAISAAEYGARAIVLEQHPRVGKKLLATGNGRCNLLNSSESAEHYHGESGNISADCAPLLAWFEARGLICREESEGRIYPASGCANAVVDVLRNRLERLGADIRTGWTVQSIRKGSGFTLSSASGDTLRADRVVIAAGGKAGTASKDAYGYDLLRGLGHRITPLRPALAPLIVNPESIRGLKGVRAKAGVSLRIGDRLITEEYGEIIFSDESISGIPAMQCARWVQGQALPAALHIDLLPERSADDLQALIGKYAAANPRAPAETIMRGLVHPRVAACLLRAAGMRADASADSASWNGVARLLRDWVIPVTGAAEFHRAQVTAGGADISQFNMDTMESLLVPSLYAAGEILDVDGDCGGYNLMWAWQSGITAGLNAARS